MTMATYFEVSLLLLCVGYPGCKCDASCDCGGHGRDDGALEHVNWGHEETIPITDLP